MRVRLALSSSAAIAVLVALLVPTLPTSAAPPPPPTPNVAAASAAADEAKRILDAHAEPAYRDRPGAEQVTPDPQPMEHPSGKATHQERQRQEKSACPAAATTCAEVSSTTLTTDSARNASQEVQRVVARSGAGCTVTATSEVRWTATSRTSGCAVVRFGITVRHHPSGTLAGTSTLYMLMTMASNNGYASLYNTAYLWVATSSGVGAPTSTEGEVMANCGSGRIYCEAQHGGWGHAAESGAWHGSADLAMLGLAKKGVETTTGSGWSLSALNPEWDNVVYLYAEIGTARCDDAVGGKSRPGCVIPSYRPTWAIPSLDYPQFASHVSRALDSGLPGARSNNYSYLKRMSSESKASKNGRTACPKNLDRPKGYQCDEYPFRSTYYGAYYGNKASQRKARSFSGCQMDDPRRTGKHGWSRCFILTNQNLGAGGKLGAFYASERVLDKDKFYIGFL